MGYGYRRPEKCIQLADRLKQPKKWAPETESKKIHCHDANYTPRLHRPRLVPAILAPPPIARRNPLEQNKNINPRPSQGFVAIDWAAGVGPPVRGLCSMGDLVRGPRDFANGAHA